MSTIRHLFLFLGYGALAGVAAFYLPIWLPAMDWMLASVAATVLFLVAALLHESYSRMGHETLLTNQLLIQHRAYSELEEELTWTRREVKAVREALEAVAVSGRHSDGSAALGEVMSEVNMLKSLVGRLARSTEAPSDKTAGAKPREKMLSRSLGKSRLSAPLPVGQARRLDEVASDVSILDLVREALRDDQIDIVLQPIVSLPQRKRRFYECYSRLRLADGTKLLPEQYISVAEQAGLITVIDNMLLFRCIQLVRKIQRKSQDISFFCNLSPHTLADEDFFDDFIDFMQANAELATHMIFEFTQESFARQGPVETRNLQRLAKLGCRFSIDQVKEVSFDTGSLNEQNIRFVKVNANSILGQETDETQPALRVVKAALKANQIDLIVEKIEDEETLVELLEQGLDYGQGYLFGEPRPTARSSE